MTTTTTTATTAEVGPRGRRWWTGLRAYWTASSHFQPVLIVLVLLLAALSVTEPAFLTSANVRNLLTGIAVVWVVSLGQTFVVLSGGIDLSVGATAALVGVLMGKLAGSGLPSVLLLAVALLFGFVVGAATNGLLIGRFHLSFFVVTLAFMTTITGVVSLWSNIETVYVADALVAKIGYGDLAGIPVAIWIMVLTLILALLLQSRTYFGRDVYAIGGSLNAARLSGIRTERTLILVYGMSGACAAIGGIISVGRISAASPQVDVTLPLQAAAAVLLGGTLLKGGTGGVGGTAVGVVFIGTLQNGLSIAGIPSFWQQVVTGLILVVAVAGARRATTHGSVARQFTAARGVLAVRKERK